MKLPDSIIAATSLHIEVPLLTADTGFKKISKLTLALFEE
jgi:predicted nucleic acid-binding protein